MSPTMDAKKLREYQIYTNKKDNNRFTITIPEGYKVESSPESIAIGLPEETGFFKFKISVTQRVINVQSILQFNKSIVSPVIYPQLKEFYKQIVSKNLEKIILVKE